MSPGFTVKRENWRGQRSQAGRRGAGRVRGSGGAHVASEDASGCGGRGAGPRSDSGCREVGAGSWARQAGGGCGGAGAVEAEGGRKPGARGAVGCVNSAVSPSGAAGAGGGGRGAQVPPRWTRATFPWCASGQAPPAPSLPARPARLRSLVPLARGAPCVRRASPCVCVSVSRRCTARALVLHMALRALCRRVCVTVVPPASVCREPACQALS